MHKTNKTTKLVIVALLIIAMAAPFVVGSKNNYMLNILISFCYYGILTASLNLMLGYTGQISLGHAAFMAIGGYSYAILTKTCGMHFLPALVLAVVISALFGLVVGLACCKLSTIYLAMTTVGFFKAVTLFLTNEGWLTGGANGFTGIQKWVIFGFKLKNFHFYFVALALTCLVFLICYRLIYSKTGRAMQALCSAPIAAAAMGVNVNRYKMLVCCISAGMAGMAGCIYAVNMSYLSADMFNTTSTILLTMTVVGGMGSLFGPLVGTVLIAVMPETLRAFANHLDGVYGLLIILVILLMPRGVYGSIMDLISYTKRKLSERKTAQNVAVGDAGQED